MEKKKIKKGDYGYLNKNKLIQLTITLFLLILVVIIFYTGVIKYGNTKNVFTVFACLMAIPAAKFGVAYIVMAPYKTGSKELYEQLRNYENIHLLSDLLISSPEKIYSIPFAAIRDNSVFCYVSNEKYEASAVEKYIKSFLEKECKITGVKIYRKEEQFIKAVALMDKNESGKYDKRIKELMLVFSM